ncbi:MAG TPA: hypothetical protein VLL52_08000 [Anaerolineae bacterium]|nr:hypothetical protein [Anaerolineae bacterium]
MMIRRFKQWVWMLVVGGILVVGCTVEEKGMKPNADWSRGLPIGQFARGAATVATDEGGTAVNIVWPTDINGEDGLRYVLLGGSGEIEAQYDLSLPAGMARQPQLMSGADQEIDLVWAQRLVGARGWTLWHGVLEAEVGLVESQPLTDEEMEVGQYDIAADGEGGLWLVWENLADDSIYGGYVDREGVWGGGYQLSEGSDPGVVEGDDEQLYLVWMANNWLQFGEVEADWTIAEPVAVRNLALSQGDILVGPDVRVADGWAYLFWGIFSTSGLESGVGHTDYIMINLTDMSMTVPERMFLSPAEKLPYEAHEGDYNLSELVTPQDVRGSSSYVFQGSVAPIFGDEVLIAVSMEQAMGMGARNQLAVGLFREGVFEGYGMAARTASVSQNPAISVDGEGDIHLVWQEGGSGRRIFYATTEPTLRQNIDQLTADDVLPLILNGGVDMVVGLLFFWLGVVWLGPGLAFLYAAQWRGYLTELDERLSQILVVMAVILAQVSKFTFIESMKSYVPFSAWIDIPVDWVEILRVGVPVSFVLISLVVTWLIGRRRYMSPTVFYFTWMGIDALLTLAIYGVTLVGSV